MSWVSIGPSPIEGRGLFVLQNCPAGTVVTSYHGPIVATPPAPDKDGHFYGWELEAGRWIDGSSQDNLGRFANHSCDPNTEAVRKGDKVELVTLRALSQGDEITLDYGLSLAEALDQPCHCGAATCAGRMIASPLRGLLSRVLRRRIQPRD